jgi:hypothetical protein
MVRLTPSQQRVQHFKHPLLDFAPPPLTELEIAELLARTFDGDGVARNELILGHLALLRHTVGRYLAHWPLTRRFLDEMVSSGLFGITRAMSKLTAEILRDREIGSYLANHIKKHIEEGVARLRGIAPASVRTNQRRVEMGLDPIFGEVVDDVDNPALVDGYCYIETGFEEFDVLEAIEQLRGEFEQLDIVFDRKNWGLNDGELSDLTGIPRRTVNWYRSELLRRYRELTGD